MGKVGRYSLVAIDRFGKREAIKMKELSDGKTSYFTKVKLATIDKNVTNFNNESDMTNYLTKYSKVSITPIKYQIEYLYNGKTKTLPLIFKNNQLIYYLSRQSDSYVPKSDKYFLNIINTLIKKFKNPEFYRFMTEKKYINPYLREKIVDYIYNPDGVDTDDEFLKEKIVEEMTSYKIIRGIVIGNVLFDNFNKKRDKNILEEKKLEKEIEDTEKYGDVITLYKRGGHDELFKYYPIDFLHTLPKVVLDQINIKQ